MSNLVNDYIGRFEGVAPATFLEDWPAFKTSLLAMLEKSEAPQMQYVDVECALDYAGLAMCEGRVWKFGKFAVMVDIGSDWYTTSSYLIEQLVIKVFPNPTDPQAQWPLQSVITRGLRGLEQHYGCVCTAAGDTQTGAMSEVYLDAGFTLLGAQFMRSNYGIRPQTYRCARTD